MSLIQTRLLGYVLEEANNLSANENRETVAPVLDLFIRDTPNLVNPTTLRGIKGSRDRPVQIPVLNRANTTVTNAGLTCTVPDTINVSAMLNLNYVTHSFQITQYPHQFANNYISEQEDFNNQFKDGINKIKIAIEAQCVAALNNNRNQVWNPTTLGPFTQTANALRVTPAQRAQAFNTITPYFGANDFPTGQLNVAAGYGVWPDIMYWMNQGAANSVNSSFQFLNFNFNFSRRVTPGLTSIGSAFVMPRGTVGIVEWIPGQFSDPNSPKTGDKIWDRVFVPELGMDMGVYYTYGCADNSVGSGDSSATAVERKTFGFTISVATIVSYNSNIATQVSPIVRMEFDS